MSDNTLNEEMVSYVTRVRETLHQNPELSGCEIETSQLVFDHISELPNVGIVASRVGGGYGLLARIPATAGGGDTVPTIALRGDMDSLPIQEETGLEYASQNPGIMAACGHDVHTAALLGAAQILATRKDRRFHTLLLFQGAEETGEGALQLIRSGALEEVDVVIGGHVDINLAVGCVALQPGCVNASSDEFVIVVRGKGGHGARPHEGRDAIVVGAAIVSALQTIVSRETDPGHTLVVSVGEFTAGSAPNIIAEEARMRGTMRARSMTTREEGRASVDRIVMGIATAMGASAEVEWNPVPGTPPVINPPDLAKAVRERMLEAGLPSPHIETLTDSMGYVNMGAEDYAWYGQGDGEFEPKPTLFARIGCTGPDNPNPAGAHSSRFAPHAGTVPTMTAYLVAAASAAAAHFSS